MVSKSYRKNIVEGKSFLAFAITFSIIMRVTYYFFGNTYDMKSAVGGYLWNPISFIFANRFYSLLTTTLSLVFIAILLAYINNTYTLIRRRTLLPPAMSILLFSCSPSFFVMTPDYIAALVVLLMVKTFLASYNEANKQQTAFSVSFYLALGSLFSPVLLIYTPIVWIGLLIMRSMNFKAFLASLLGFVFCYAPVLSYFVFTNDLNTFYNPFLSINTDLLTDLPILKFNIQEWIILAFSLLLLCIMFIDNYLTSYKDKIKTRAYFTFFGFFIFFALLLFLSFNFYPKTNLYIILIFASLLLSHFFALAESKWITYVFYTYILCFVFVIYSFFIA